MIGSLFPLLALVFSIVLREAFVRNSQYSRVDHHYWILAARAYRARKRLPAVIRGKYLLEDERQAYPPLFGILLAAVPERWLSGPQMPRLMQFGDLSVIAALYLFGHAAGLELETTVLILVYGTAPVLVAYNTQLNPRALGNLFLVAKCVLEILAVMLGPGEPLAWLAWLAATGFAALIVLTHKMTTQLMFAMWPIWPFALGAWQAALVPLAGVGLASLAVGKEMARLQWLAHYDIVRFWNRHHRRLGAHAFRDSPIYGEGRPDTRTLLHKGGPAGILSHVKILAGYGPLILLLPVTLIFVDAPPPYVFWWWAAAVGFALATLFIGPLKCLGAGYYYLFNAAAPSALWWAMVFPGSPPAMKALFAAGLALTVLALVMGFRVRAGRDKIRDPGFDAALDALGREPTANLAVFPLNAADEAALRTPHTLLWGGHGYGFDRLTSIFPVVSRPLDEVFSQEKCSLILIDSGYWPDAEAAVGKECAPASIEAFGRWRLFHCPQYRVGPAEVHAAGEGIAS